MKIVHKWLAGAGAAIAVILVGAYIFVPVVRYVLIPVAGDVRAPKLESQAGGPPQALPANYEIVPGLLADSRHVVENISQVPSEGGWMNSGPLSFKHIYAQNKYILIDFWTYTCINCIRATPYSRELWNRYKDHGLVVIGVHSPEFDIEREPKNILAAMQRAGITYPVLTDADKKVWNEFGNHFWPGKYLINPQGKIIYTQFGEGNYAEEEQRIRRALTSSGWNLPLYGRTGRFLVLSDRQQTPELYAGPGFLRRAYGNEIQPKAGVTSDYVLPKNVLQDRIYLNGSWQGKHDYVVSKSEGSIVLDYLANAVYIVLDNQGKPRTVEVLLDGKPVPQNLQGRDIEVKAGKTMMRVDDPRLYYPISEQAPYGRHIISFVTPAGLKYYSFTFGTYCQGR